MSSCCSGRFLTAEEAADLATGSDSASGYSDLLSSSEENALDDDVLDASSDGTQTFSTLHFGNFY